MIRPESPLGLLLLEDSPADSRLLVESLREHVDAGELVIQTVRRLADALRELKRFRFSCVLVDLGLPDGEGVAHVGRIREADPRIAIVVLTGLSDQRAAEEAFRLGAQDYLIKGERYGDELLAFVRRAIEKVQPVDAAEPSTGGSDTAAANAELRTQPWVSLARASFAGVHLRGAIDMQTLAPALDALRTLRDSGVRDVPFALSVTPAAQAAVFAALPSALAEAGIAPAMLVLRVAAAHVASNNGTDAALERLRALGLRVWLEGWTPDTADLRTLCTLAVDGLVLDASLASTTQGEERAQRFVRATLALGGALGLDVLAEGIDLADQYQRLALIGVRTMQGAWFCEPEAPADLPRRWRKGPWGLERRGE